MRETPAKPYPHSGICGYCCRERDDLFWHDEDQALYCADVFRCEARVWIIGQRPLASVSPEATDA